MATINKTDLTALIANKLGKSKAEAKFLADPQLAGIPCHITLLIAEERGSQTPFRSVSRALQPSSIWHLQPA